MPISTITQFTEEDDKDEREQVVAQAEQGRPQER